MEAKISAISYYWYRTSDLSCFWSRDRRSQRPMDYGISCWWLTVQVGKLVNSKLWTGNLGKDVSQLYKSKLNVTSWHLCNQTAPDSAVFLDFFGLLVVVVGCWLLVVVGCWLKPLEVERKRTVGEREREKSARPVDRTHDLPCRRRRSYHQTTETADEKSG